MKYLIITALLVGSMSAQNYTVSVDASFTFIVRALAVRQ
jgi:hypothetical protein